MEPVSGVAGALSASRRIGLYLVMALTSVLVPGAVLLAEITVLVAAGDGGDPRDPLALPDGLNGVVTVVLLLAVAYIIGYLSREAGFTLLGLVERTGPARPASAVEARRRLIELFGRRAVAECLDNHPVLRRLFGLPPNAAQFGAEGGAHQLGTAFQIFQYSKLWLHTYSPASLSVASLEVEINILASIIGPTAMLTADLIVVIEPHPLVGVAITVGGLIALVLILASLVRKRRAERWEAIRNLMAEYTMFQARQRMEATATGSDDAPGPAASRDVTDRAD